MIDTIKEREWLQDWVNDQADEGTKDLDTRKWSTDEVEQIMLIYATELAENNVGLHSVVGQSEQLVCDHPSDRLLYKGDPKRFRCSKCGKEIAI